MYTKQYHYYDVLGLNANMNNHRECVLATSEDDAISRTREFSNIFIVERKTTTVAPDVQLQQMLIDKAHETEILDLMLADDHELPF